MLEQGEIAWRRLGHRLSRAARIKHVGWVECSEPHQHLFAGSGGARGLDPPYSLLAAALRNRSEPAA